MKVRIKKVDWSLNDALKEGTVLLEINGSLYYASCMHDDYQTGEIADVEFAALEEDHTWEQRFEKNHKKIKQLVHRQGWSYHGFAEITSINPVVADFGDIVLELGNWTNDQRVIGEYIYWPIAELTIHKKPIYNLP